MTWPAPTLPIDFTNATAQQDLHPAAHNTTNQSLNDNFRPELIRVGDDLAGTRSVFQGEDPALNAFIEANSLRIRAGNVARYDGGTQLGRVMYRPGSPIVFANKSTSLVTNGSTPRPYLGVAYPTNNLAGWGPNGGVLEVTATALFNHQGESATSTAVLACGLGLPPTPRLPGDPSVENEPTAWPTATGRTRAELSAGVTVGGFDIGVTNAGLQNRWLFDIAANQRDEVWAWVGIAHVSGPALLVTSGAIQVRAWAD